MPSGTYRFETVHRVGTSSFLSGTGRGADVDDTTARWAPGPGTYGSTGFTDGLPQFGSAAFKSKRTHGRAPAPTPGPGAYTLKSTIKGTTSVVAVAVAHCRHSLSSFRLAHLLPPALSRSQPAPKQRLLRTGGVSA